MGHEAWLDRFASVGAAMTPEGYASLFADDGTLLDAGASEPLPQHELAEHMQGLLALIPDLAVVPIRTRSRGNTIFIDAANRGTVRGVLIEWPAIYVATLRDGEVARGRRYYDRLPFAERLLPDVPRPPVYESVRDPDLFALPNEKRFEEGRFVKEYAALWQEPDPRRFVDFYATDGRMTNPGMERPLVRSEIPGYYAFLLGLVSDASMEQLDWAEGDGLVFIEWELTGTLAGTRISTRAADRFLLVDGQIVDGRGYFDRLGLLEAISPELRQRSAAGKR